MMTVLLCCLGIGSAAEEDVTANTALLWQGFEHNWQRTVAGAWAVPHRVSLFETRIDNEQHTLEEGELTTTAQFHFSQSTGVDGDYMLPVGHYSRVYAPDLQVERGTMSFSIVDSALGLAAPKSFRTPCLKRRKTRPRQLQLDFHHSLSTSSPPVLVVIWPSGAAMSVAGACGSGPSISKLAFRVLAIRELSGFPVLCVRTSSWSFDDDGVGHNYYAPTSWLGKSQSLEVPGQTVFDFLIVDC